jgi:hypothetical protein
MQKILIAALVLALSAQVALATQCRDSSGKFIKCPAPATQPVHCRNSSGQYVKCGTPGAHAA